MAVHNILKDYIAGNPIVSILFLVITCAVFRFIDVFVLRLDEPPVSEIILSKTLGLLALVIYLWIIGSSLWKIGFNSTHILENTSIATGLVLLGLVIIFGCQLLYFRIKVGHSSLSIQHYSLFFILVSVIAGNIINALMEEGLFRGLMITQLMNYTSFWRANLVQAGVFGIWHLIWPLKDLYVGKINSIGTLVGMSAGEVLVTFFMGLTMGYLFYKTGSLWTAFTWHFVMNLAQNVLIIRSSVDVESAVVDSSSTLVKGIAFIIVLIITNTLVSFK